VRITEGASDLLLGTRNGWAIRFREENVRPMGRSARGVRGIRLRDGQDADHVVGMAVIPREEPATLLTVCEKGYGKRTPTSDYPTKNRGGKGVITIKTTERNGKVVGLRLVTDDDDLMLITDGGKAAIQNVPLIGFAQAGAGGFFDDGGFPVGKGWDEIAFPAVTDEHAYALEISGDSMKPAYRAGDVIMVSPGATVRKGDRVVVKTKDGEVMVKELKRKTAKAIELKSLNAEHRDRTLPMSDVLWVARIVWASQ